MLLVHPKCLEDGLGGILVLLVLLCEVCLNPQLLLEFRKAAVALLLRVLNKLPHVNLMATSVKLCVHSALAVTLLLKGNLLQHLLCFETDCKATLILFDAELCTADRKCRGCLPCDLCRMDATDVCSTLLCQCVPLFPFHHRKRLRGGVRFLQLSVPGSPQPLHMENGQMAAVGGLDLDDGFLSDLPPPVTQHPPASPSALLPLLPSLVAQPCPPDPVGRLLAH
mmetsp:Transcript_21795/g.36896  ORF Transcript_21795/g.36896 Transcript_21795/m.36896 type:complete len:224 (+) Transcript_21795:2783-3454(+)